MSKRLNLEHLIEDDLEHYMNEHDLGDYVCILKGNIPVEMKKKVNEIKEKNPEVIGIRNDYCFMRCLIYGKVVESFFIDYIKRKEGIDLKYDGTDKKEILTEFIGSQADLIDKNNNIKIEIASSINGFSYEHNRYDFRGNKLKNLKKFQEDAIETYIFIVDVKYKAYQVLKLSEIKYSYCNKNQCYNQPALQVFLKKENWKYF